MAIPMRGWHDLIRVSPKLATRAIDKLKKTGVIETAVYKFNGTPVTHISLNETRFRELYALAMNTAKQDTADQESEIAQEAEASQESAPDSGLIPMGLMDSSQRDKWTYPNGINGLVPTGLMDSSQRDESLTEITTEITTEIKTQNANAFWATAPPSNPVHVSQSKPDKPPGRIKKPPNPLRESPAIKAIRHVMHYNVPDAWLEAVAGAVSEHDLDEWTRFITDWIGAGYNPHNIRGILDAWRKSHRLPLAGSARKTAEDRVSARQRHNLEVVRNFLERTE